MAKTDTFEPKQKRSIEKKKHIIETGIQLMAAQGYHHTTTDDIAAAAGVSTGIIYRYFKDKHDILLEGLSLYFHKMEENNYFTIDTSSSETILEFSRKMIRQFLSIHEKNWYMHEELEAMRHSDPEVAGLYDATESAIITKITSELQTRGDAKADLPERVYAVFHLIEGYCHMYMRTISPEINLERMHDVTLHAICDLLS